MKDDTLASRQQALEELSKKLEQSEAKAAALETEVEAAAGHAIEQARDIERLQAAEKELLASKEKEADAAKSRMAELQCEIEALQLSAQEAQNGVTNLQELQLELENYRALTQAQSEDHRVQRERFEVSQRAKDTVVTELNEEVSRMKSELDKKQWAHKQAQHYKKSFEGAEEKLKEMKKEADAWRSKYEAKDVDEERLKRQEELVQELEGERKAEHHQNRELALEVQHLQQEVAAMESMNRDLKEKEEILEQELQSYTETAAECAGHTNHKQKIRYTIKLKDDNARLRDEVVRMRQQMVQLEASRRGESLFEAVSVGTGFDPNTSVTDRVLDQRTPRRSVQAPRTPHRNGPASARGNNASGARSASQYEEKFAAVDATQRLQLQGRALERLSNDYHLLASMAERVVNVCETGEQTHCCGGDSEDAVGNGNNGSASSGALVERLRRLLGGADAEGAMLATGRKLFASSTATTPRHGSDVGQTGM
mmetsp:Transcript_18101/g.32830  ORF Transcript_18101/g.32830 Transcript_18101/m.32830 type:complete len:484 (-) Transcript_18101:87-1538(-)